MKPRRGAIFKRYVQEVKFSWYRPKSGEGLNGNPEVLATRRTQFRAAAAVAK
jgi:hypothetical protein